MRPRFLPQIIVLTVFILFVMCSFWIDADSASTAWAQTDPTAASVVPAAVNAPQGIEIQIWSRPPIYLGEQTVFTATVTGADASTLDFFWQFGDTKTAEGQVVAHT